jgi:DtxR family Mn-dependent transcriptional regulator
MVDPARALAVFAGLVLGLAALAWPRRGALALLRRTRRATERVRVEDAVKYLFHAGDAGAAVRPEALAGALAVRESVARTLLARLVERGLAHGDGAGFRLTAGGRRDALRLVRTHRLVEQWLADRTGVEPGEWHAVAEEVEHELTSAEVEALAARLGQPRFDPHGDPIPTVTGELPEDDRVLLGALAPGEAGTVAHLEDEPAEAYAALREAGLALGRPLVVHARDARTVQLELDGARVVLPRLLEAGVSVLRAPHTRTERPATLADLAPGQGARVLAIDHACRGAQRRRLLDLGIVPGTQVTAVLRSAGGDPVAYDVRGALIGLRAQQAAWILIDAGSIVDAGAARVA